MKTEAAQCAKAIKKELSKKFPNIKFSVTSDNFAGGNSVSIHYTNGVPQAEVEAITGKYQYGHFDGMIDCYEYSNGRDDIPQAKYVSVSREVSEDILAKTKAELAKEYGIDKPEIEAEWMKVFNQWPQQVVWRELAEKTL